jgi:hypothetical protein
MIQVPTERIAHYMCRKTHASFPIDGDLDKDVWKNAEKSRPFVDLVTGEPAFMETRIASLWDERNLYVAFWITEPNIRASQTQRDSFVWYDNDVEVFFDGEDCYYEFEVNALNTIYEVFFIYQDALRADASKTARRFAEFDLYSRDVDVLSGFQDAARYGKHPRGKRWAFMDYDFPNLQTMVKLDGTINTPFHDPSRADRGWTMEAAFPWEGFSKMYASRTFPPRQGDTLRAAFFRFENLRHNGKSVEGIGWALNEHNVYDSHIPENFSYLHFEE